jgi:hypothetical protein
MKELNLNIDHWSMLDFNDSSESQTFNQDLIATLDNISNTNISDSLCDLNDHEYVH